MGERQLLMRRMMLRSGDGWWAWWKVAAIVGVFEEHEDGNEDGDFNVEMEMSIRLLSLAFFGGVLLYLSCLLERLKHFVSLSLSFNIYEGFIRI
ncbi:hypothetical protein IHE45_01G083400 [Dioscorea alata]|uniref:Uncharacterized protein n=1 Tax=Dioscorea alata TaxID=55571 RepID=A0ACB7WWA6_DIOAL|nr:hypothetical protein IHE45_01G083400 [Dioscorea alata]